MNILFIGDIVGRLGRKAVTKALPGLRKRLNIDFVIANVENIAHGKGVTRRTLQEMSDIGIHCFTSGNHIWKNKEVIDLVDEEAFPLLRPANYPKKTPGTGCKSFTISKKKVYVVNLLGRVCLTPIVDNPFLVIQEVLAKIKEKNSIVIVDFHAEVTSEKKAFGYMLDGKVSAVLGTHTHVQTADETLLPHGTAYITDVGFVGGSNTVLGVEAPPIVQQFLTGMPAKHDFPKHGPATLNAVLLSYNSKGSVVSIRRVTKNIVIKE